MRDEYLAKRDEQAMLLREQGLQYKDIAKQLGVCTSRARQLVENASLRKVKLSWTQICGG